eukprot:TRINITY_DN9336_c0_g1_i7.p1 TRINITY_DN9336_c0_g1~~TRINITY_DN9336_c0_g1_i7.p1  ORF type:complete len:515 (+),score=112.87 TRINITY_DN9336_c0_g1_i7:238-1782(+)
MVKRYVNNRTIMHRTAFLLFALLFFYAHAEIIELTDSTYDQTVNEHPFVVVNYVKPDCEECDVFQREYESIATTVRKTGMPLVLAKIDCDKNYLTARKERIRTMPSIKLFINGNPFEYEDDMKAKNVLAFISKKTRPSSLPLNSEEAIENIKQSKELMCIYAISGDSKLAAYMDLGFKQQDFLFYHAPFELLKKVFPEVKENSVVLLKDFDEKIVIYDGEIGDELENFLNTHRTPILDEATSVFMQLISGNERSKAALLFVNPSNTSTISIEETFTKAAKMFRGGNLIFSIFRTTDTTAWKVADFIGIDANALPILTVVEIIGHVNQYRHDGPMTEEAIKGFIENWQSGKVERYKISEPEPEENPGPLYKIVGKTFNSFVLDNDDDILIDFNAPPCRGCKEVRKVFRNLASSLSGNKKLRVAEMNTAKNDLDEYRILPEPVAVLYPGKDKANPVRFEGNVTGRDLAKFVQEHASNPVTIPESVLTSKEEPSKEKQKSDLCVIIYVNTYSHIIHS